MLRVVVLLLALASAHSACPYATRNLNHGPDTLLGARNPHASAPSVDFNAVAADIKALLTSSQDFWPADFGNYGPFFIRLAWHCAGSYRTSDGRGGCDGGRQRFEPERSWDDNTNLDKARKLLQPIKLKYGPGLSWGDLIILAGTTAISSMGGPVLGFCGGRIDDTDGTASLPLGPSVVQAALAPCPINGQCTAPLGATTIGLIYVNPEGPMGVPNPEVSALQVRDTFGRMALNDSETVALIGGGHAFGKVHGACPTGPGPAPKDDPTNPWPGTCGSGALKGKGPNTFTSGFEGSWTDQPTEWTNDYYNNLLNYDWTVHVGPGGHHQWQPNKKEGGPDVIPIMMLTSDISLLKDGSYLSIVKEFAADQSKLDVAFAAAWYKMVSRDMGPATRCIGPNVPPPQPFQYPLPPAPAPSALADFTRVKADIYKALWTLSDAAPPDFVGGKAYYGALFSLLAWQCTSTFRSTDYLGGCNGARIRLSPQKDWEDNLGLDKVLNVLQPIKAKYGAGLSWADLIVLAGTTANEAAGVPPMKFCGGRVDLAADDGGSDFLQQIGTPDTVERVRDLANVMGLTSREVVAVMAQLRSPYYLSQFGMPGAWTKKISSVSNEYFKTLLSETWVLEGDSGTLYKAVGKDIYMISYDMVVTWDAEYLAIAQEYASDNAAFLSAFSSAWTHLMNADRFAGPGKNLCTTLAPRDWTSIIAPFLSWWR